MVVNSLVAGLLCLVIDNGCPEIAKPISGFVGVDEFIVASEVAGQLRSMPWRRGDQLAEQDLIFALEHNPEEFDLINAKLTYEQAKANYDLANKQYFRMQKLLEQHAVSADSFDHYDHSYKITSKQLAIETEKINKLTWVIEKKQGTSPFSAQIKEVYHQVGEYVKPGEPIVSLVRTAAWYATLYIPQSDLDQYQIGDELEITTGPNTAALKSKIVAIASQPEFTPPVIYDVNYSGNYVYRIRVEFGDDCHRCERQLHPGAAVFAKVKSNA